MKLANSYFLSLKQSAERSNHRLANVIDSSDSDWVDQCIDKLLSLFANETVVILGDGKECANATSLAYNKGNAFLGQDIDLLLVNLSSGFDANSFNSLCGCLRGGGLLFFYNRLSLPSSYGKRWLERALQRLPVIHSSDLDCPITGENSNVAGSGLDFSQQQEAVENIIKVAVGRNKRPLVLTADRGRGKTSALGIAVSELFQMREFANVIICAPLLASVDSAFFHAQRLLNGSIFKQGRLTYQGSSLQFVAPDALLSDLPQCDMLLIDEAASIPVPILEAIANRYTRVVFSSTQHGYEGCGRGFSLKFLPWLTSRYSNVRFCHLSRPIRWAESDPLETWLNTTFLLDTFIPTIAFSSFNLSSLSVFRLEKSQLYQDESFSREVFSLLASAHYQTSPNDWFSLLNDDAITVYVVMQNEALFACALVVEEGPIESHLVGEVSLGIRRPPGHLVPITLINQLGVSSVSTLVCTRIMRIAVHSEMERNGIGSLLVNHIVDNSCTDYVATSFGLTSELHDFWIKSQFIPVKLGSRRDHVSGTYSGLYLRVSSLEFVAELNKQFLVSFPLTAHSQLASIDCQLLKKLLTHNFSYSTPIKIPFGLLQRYCGGGANFESVEPFLRLCILCYPYNNRYLSDLMIQKVVAEKSWKQCSQLFSFDGKRNTEEKFRADLDLWLSHLQCKP